MKKMSVGKRVAVLVMAMGLAGCSTVTPYSKDIAKESPRFGALTRAEAAQIIRSQADVSGEIADYGSFVVDEEGFSFRKTTEEEKTEWKGKKPTTRKWTSTTTRNIPWDAITEISPYMEEYKAPFHHIRYRIELDFETIALENGSRVREREDLVLNCRSYQALVDVTAALKVLTRR